MNLRDQLLSIKESIHPFTFGDHTIYFKHLKASHNAIIDSMCKEDINIVAFIIAACDEKGESLFTFDDIEEVKKLPRNLVNVISNAALFGDEKKPLGV